MSMNAWIGPFPDNDVGEDWTHYRVYQKDSDMGVPGPANLWLFMDENPYSINDGFLLEQATGSGSTGVAPIGTTWTDYPATYHNHACGISFCDGHAQIRKWTDPVLIDFKGTSGTSTAATRPYTDIYWLLARTTAHK
jgi:prepilin-type processing-associated H-X9-DG protein